MNYKNYRTYINKRYDWKMNNWDDAHKRAQREICKVENQVIRARVDI